MGRLRGDLPKRTIQFGVRILNISDELPNGNKGWVVGKQLIRAGTSIGANVREADNAWTDVEFAHKCSIARREGSETSFWLDLCLRASLLSGAEPTSLLKEADELTRILSAIVRETQHYIERSTAEREGGAR
jgi:four helix bundle protein